MDNPSSEYRTDVLIVGSAGAGLRAAIEAAKGAKVLVLSKGPYARGGATVMAGADIMLDGKSLSEMGLRGDPEDSKEKFFRDILIEGFELNNQPMVEAYVEEAPNRVRELLDWGLKIDPERIYSRAIIAGGRSILQALHRKVKDSGVESREYFMATDLLMRDGSVCGIMGVDTRSGEIVRISAKAVILATGGWHELFSFNTGSEELTGDGPAMALRAGASLTNMEMITFCPNILLAPPAYRGTVLLYNFLNGKLLNSHGDEFLLWEDPSILRIAQTSEWNKLIYSRASWKEITAGRGTPNGGVYYSLRHVPPQIWERLRQSKRWKNGWKFQGKDFTTVIERLREGGAVEVAPAAHYFEGGIRVDAACRTSIPGLFAAGECTGELFGANRVSAATTEMLVHGAIAGRSALAYCSGLGRAAEPDQAMVRRIEETLAAPLLRDSGIRAFEIKGPLQELAYKRLGPVRDKASLIQAAAEAERFEKDLDRIRAPSRRRENRAWIDALEVRNLIQLLRATSISALERQESRGVHSRRDFPLVNNRCWLKNVLVCLNGGRMELSTEPVALTSVSPEPGVLSYEDAIRKAVKGGGEGDPS